MINYLEILEPILLALSSKQFFLLIETIALLTAITIGSLLVKKFLKRDQSQQAQYATFYLLLIIITSMIIENCAWILRLCYQLNYAGINYKFVQWLSVVAWIFSLIGYQALGLFIENIIENKLVFRWHQKVFVLMHCFFIPMFIYTNYYHIYNLNSFISIHTIFRIACIYRFLMIIPSIFIGFTKIESPNIPAILKKQLTIFLNYIIFPLLISDFLQSYPIFSPQGALADVSGLIAPICISFMIAAIIFCALNLIRFRFLNFSNKIQDRSNNSLTGSFKNSIQQVSLATTPQELAFITQNFFKENFDIKPENVCLSFRYTQEACSPGNENYCNETNNTIESFINKENPSIDLLRQYRILVTDEIMFDAYYNQNEHEMMIAEFLNMIRCEIFLPMYDKNSIIAYLTIQRGNDHKFYSIAEQNKIVIFGTYLASTINIMHNSNTTTLMHENKKVKEELYLKHQEINQYKESIKSLLKQKMNSQVGILFYKDDRFTLGNEVAQNLLTINLNQQRKHPATVTILKLAQQVKSFRTPQTCFLYDNNNKQLMVTGIPHLDYQSGVILTIHYADISDIIKTHIDKLENPSQIDYLLYLETTKSGKLINQLIPSNNESLLQFKIKLLEITLHKKATLLQSHTDDLLSIVEIIHHISLRHTLHIIDLKPTVSNHDLAIKLFGLNPLLMQEQEDGLLKKLDQKGTLFIKNVELLDLETQNKLAQFIRYGIFTITKSEQRITSDVRIICSVSQNPQTLIEQNKLSVTLYKELAETTVAMPSLLTMDEKELQELVDAYAHQALESNDFSTLLQMSNKDKEQLLNKKPASLQEFKSNIQLLLSQKSKDYHIIQETYYDPEFKITNPKLLKAANLGKHALKDAEIMSMLWEQFKCQNKIAQFLGVNRSSVQRRCKEYNLL